MNKKVIINIKGKQGIEGDIESVELTTEGTLTHSNGEFLVSYSEGEMMGQENVDTVLQVKGNDTVVLKRSGGINSRLTIERGIRNSCIYNAGVGEIVLGIFGNSIKNELNENGGRLYMNYTIDSDLKLISNNTVEISVKEVKTDVNSCN